MNKKNATRLNTTEKSQQFRLNNKWTKTRYTDDEKSILSNIIYVEFSNRLAVAYRLLTSVLTTLLHLKCWNNYRSGYDLSKQICILISCIDLTSSLHKNARFYWFIRRKPNQNGAILMPIIHKTNKRNLCMYECFSVFFSWRIVFVPDECIKAGARSVQMYLLPEQIYI